MNIKRIIFLLALGFPLIASDVMAQDSGDAKPEAAAAEAKEEPAADAAADEKPAADGEEAPAEGAEAAPAEQLLGPGGKPLQSDYPGTEESLRPRMSTDKIQGLEVDPNAPEQAYTMRVEELQTKVDDLKEKVFQSKTRVVLLRETLLSGNMAGSRAVILHKTDLGAAFKLREALYSLDGSKIFGQIDKNGSLSDKTAFEVYNGAIAPGNHNLSVTLKYQGSGYGLFTYFDGYDFTIKSSCKFRAEEGKIVQLKAVAYAQGDLTTSKEDEPSLRCDASLVDNVPQGSDAVADDKTSEDAQ